MVMESLQRLDPPQPLGKLTLLARLGEGGMATVYVAATGHGPLARLCAVKLLRADVPDSDYRKRFMDEATLVVRLHHNNLIDVREAGEQSGQLYIVMELCEGRDLADLWDRCAAVGRAFPVPLSVYLVREALRGLHYAHTFGGLSLVHRDISPSNLLVDWAGAVRVADFGLATSVLKATATMPGMVFGKVGYMAPEQATRSELDGRADVYSCGVVLWELLTGRPLRESGLDTEAVARFAARRPSASSRRVDPSLDDIVMRALEPDPQRRFADAGQFMRALSDWLVRNAPQTDQETLAEFMRGLFSDAQVRDHAAYGALLAGVVGPTTGVFQRGETGAPTREIGPFHDTEDLSVGMIIAERYRIEQELGRGGMGTVYLAEHVTVGRKVAVKVLTREWSTHETVAKRFREEARAASAAGHPNIVEVFDAGTLPDGRLYLVMEHLHGRSLYAELCVTGPMPIESALPIFRDIARGIAAAHAVGIIHRDLKPDNVMLVRRGGEIMVKLLDFGIAASADRVAEDRRLTQPGHTLGTPEYMAPEQAKGRPPTELVDIYALGAMLYEMLVGQPPFVGENYVEVLTRKATEVAPRIELRRSDLPDHVVRLCHACLEIDPRRRPPTVAAVLQMLEDGPTTALVPIGGPGPARIEGPRIEGPRIEGRVEQLAVIRAPRAVEVRPRRAGVIAAVAGVVVVLLAGAGVWQLAASRGALGDAAGDDAGISEARLVASQGDGAAETGEVAAPVEQRVEPTPVEPRVGPPVEPPATIDPPIAKPEPARPPAVDSPACREHRDAAVKAKRSSNWSAVLEHVSAKACWTGPHKTAAVALRVRALFQTGRFAECVKAGAKSSDEDVAKVVVSCTTRLRDG